MEYLVGLVVLGLIIFGIVKAVSGNPYAEMTEEEFEADAKRASNIGNAIMSMQKVIDPSHHVEYVQQEHEKIEAEAAEAGDRPEPGTNAAQPENEIPDKP